MLISNLICLCTGNWLHFLSECLMVSSLGSSLQLTLEKKAGCWSPALDHRIHFIFRTWCQVLFYSPYDFCKLEQSPWASPLPVGSLSVAWNFCPAFPCFLELSRVDSCSTDPEDEILTCQVHLFLGQKKRKPSFHFLLTLGKWASCPGRNEMHDKCEVCLCWVMAASAGSPPAPPPPSAPSPLLLI